MGNVWYTLVRGVILHILLRSEIQAEEYQQQYFRAEPKNVVAQEGHEVTLQCEIEYRRGTVQWTKDGYALGYEPDIPGYPRYTMVGDHENGVYNLRIRNVSLEDDAEFECQVGPYRKPNQKFVSEIRASANLTVLLPPSTIEIVGFTSNSKVEIYENSELRLECRVRKSKPAARIVWYRGRSELKIENREDRVIESEESSSPRTTLYDVRSRILIIPSAEDDEVKYSCEAHHEAFIKDMYLRFSVELCVLYPPGDPFIEGYDPEKDIIRRGQNVELICRSKGGNPLAQLVWYRNDEEVRAVSLVSGKFGRTSENILSFIADKKDNNAKYTCKASSVYDSTQKKVETVLTVNYAPLHVNIVGATEARIGDLVQLNCTTGASNPAAVIRWMLDGHQIVNNGANNSGLTWDQGNGWLTWSSISIPITFENTNIVVICQGVNSLLSENVVATHTINVLYPPGEPIISGYQSGTFVEAGSVTRLSCKSVGGNPLAILTWFKNDKKIHSTSKYDKSLVNSEVQILVNATDNDAVYKCEASNSAIDIPRFQAIKFSVYFPPDNVVIRKDPLEFRAGAIGNLMCNASSSNPEANLTFWRDGIEIDNILKQSKPGLHGGNATSIVVKLNITEDMDGNLFTCQAQNPKLGRHIYHDIRLSVMYKPVFTQLNETTFMGVENENLIIPLQATGRPQSITYTWIKNGVPLARGANYIINGSSLNFTRLDRTDSGAYACEAINSEGLTLTNFTINVQYPAGIKDISNVVLVSENESAELWCVVDANPLSSEYVTWRRPGFPFEMRTISSYKNHTFYLVVRDVTRKDMGQFFCVADNGLGNETSKATYLVVKHKPEVDQSSGLQKAAARIGETARLVCRASGAPKVGFSWIQNGVPILVNTTVKYHALFHQLDAITYESVLSIQKVESRDYGQYQCKASNALGSVFSHVNFSTPSKPDPPLEIRLVNATHDAITVSWVPGFDGGEAARFKIRYRDSSTSTVNFKIVNADRNTMQTVNGLQFGTSYVLSVSAYNRIGESEYVKNMLKASTSSEAPPSLPSLSEVSSHVPGRMSLVVGAVVALTLILSNILLLVFCLLRRSRKQVVAGVKEQSSNKSGTIEMYAPPNSYNEPMSGETLSSLSEKSETYSDTRQDYEEKKRMSVGNAYVVEQMDYPFQYPRYDIHPKEQDSIGHNRNSYINHNFTGNQNENSSRYSSSSDPCYVTYPPPVQYAQQSLAPNGTLRRGTVPPPDVTVLTAPPPVSMSTFNYGTPETEGHLV